jgi:structure-specific recognition protein 1
MTTPTTQFDKIYRGTHVEAGSKYRYPRRHPLLKIASGFRIATGGMAWKGEESDVAMATGDIKWAQWLRVARNFQLRIGLKDRKRETFDGFMREVRTICFYLLHASDAEFT